MVVILLIFSCHANSALNLSF
ncbi:hypothetical protein V4B17_05785 [Bartonella sp. B23]